MDGGGISESGSYNKVSTAPYKEEEGGGGGGGGGGG